MSLTSGWPTMSLSASRTTAISAIASSRRAISASPDRPPRRSTLIGVPGHDHRRVPAQPRQYHLDLPVGAVLRLVDHDKGIVQRAAAHKRDRGDLDAADLS